MFDLIKVTREPDRHITDDSGRTVAVPGQITDVRASPLAVFGLPILLIALGLGVNYLLELAKHENAVQLACVNRAVTAGASALPPFCRLPS